MDTLIQPGAEPLRLWDRIVCTLQEWVPGAKAPSKPVALAPPPQSPPAPPRAVRSAPGTESTKPYVAAATFAELEERRKAHAIKKGGPLQTFIDLQLKAARLELKGSSHIEFGRHLDEAKKIQDLHPEWLPSWNKSIVKDHQFFAGCLERVTVEPQAFLDYGREVLRLAPKVRHLDLPRGSVIPAGFFSSPVLNKLISLRADDCDITDSLLEGIGSQQQFVWLSLANNEISQSGLAKLASIKGLRFANLRCNPSDPLDSSAADQGYVTETWQPQELLDLERRLTDSNDGRLPWFHSDWWPSPDRAPSRFLTPFLETTPK